MNPNRMKIMLVEDDPAHAEIIRRNLENMPTPSQLILIEDGQAALNYLFPRTEHQGAVQAGAYPDLIILDLRLPRVDGLEVLKIIKSDAFCHRIPVVVLTTSGASRDIQSAYDYHANSYLVKPLHSHAFVKLLTDFGQYWMTNNRFANVLPGKFA